MIKKCIKYLNVYATSLMEDSSENASNEKKVNVVNVLDCALKNQEECNNIVTDLINTKNPQII